MTGELYAFDVRTGKQRWSKGASKATGCSFTHAVGSGQRIFLAEHCPDHRQIRVVALSAGSGAEEWTWQKPIPVPHPDGATPRLTVAGGTLVVSYAEVPASAYKNGVYPDDRDENGPYPRRVVRLSMTDGTESWSQPDPRGPVYSSPPVVAGDTVVYPGKQTSWS